MPPVITTKALLCMQKAAGFKQFLGHARYNDGVSRVIGAAPATTGEMDVRMNRMREVRDTVLPTVDAVPTMNEWQFWLPMIFDAEPTGSGTTVSPFLYDPGDVPIVRNFFYQEAPVTGGATVKSQSTVAMLSGSLVCSAADQFLALSASLQGEVYNDSDTMPATPTAVDFATKPFIISDTSSGSGFVTVDGSSLRVDQITVGFEKQIRTDRYYNSLTLTDQVKLNRVTTIGLRFPYGEAPTLNNFLDVGHTVDIRWDIGGLYLRLTFPAVSFTRTPVEYGLQVEVDHQITGVAHKTSGSSSVLGRLALS